MPAGGGADPPRRCRFLLNTLGAVADTIACVRAYMHARNFSLDVQITFALACEIPRALACEISRATPRSFLRFCVAGRAGFAHGMCVRAIRSSANELI